MTSALFCLLLIQPHTETQWVAVLAPRYNAATEVRLWDGTRCDMVTKEYAIEVDWAKPGKHFEAIGQALYYALALDRKPAVMLLAKPGDEQRIHRTQAVCARYSIKLFVEWVD